MTITCRPRQLGPGHVPRPMMFVFHALDLSQKELDAQLDEELEELTLILLDLCLPGREVYCLGKDLLLEGVTDLVFSCPAEERLLLEGLIML